mmetsp:Transcript_11929/g.18413  ORF Transcript_11929/g.18413 Transcript_11929/m.18413 type:complete len:83 (-) Transcript_11929:1873-2121(-)
MHSKSDEEEHKSESKSESDEEASLAMKYGLSNEGSLAEFEENETARERPIEKPRAKSIPNAGLGESSRARLQKKFRKLQSET